VPYLICDRCNKYYKLKEGETAENFDTCQCGNEFKYYETMNEYLTDKKQEDSSYDDDSKDILNSWNKRGIEVKIIPIVVVSLILTLIIAFSGVLNVFDVSYAEVIPADIKKAHKPVIVDISATWCSACQQFQSDTLSNPQVQQKISNDYVLLKVDIDENRELAKNFKTDVVPTIIILDANYNEKGRYEGYMGPDKFLSIL
jgi:thiol:disulfide interchange protein DsbD